MRRSRRCSWPRACPSLALLNATHAMWAARFVALCARAMPKRGQVRPSGPWLFFSGLRVAAAAGSARRARVSAGRASESARHAASARAHAMWCVWRTSQHSKAHASLKSCSPRRRSRTGARHACCKSSAKSCSVRMRMRPTKSKIGGWSRCAGVGTAACLNDAIHSSRFFHIAQLHTQLNSFNLQATLIVGFALSTLNADNLVAISDDLSKCMPMPRAPSWSPTRAHASAADTKAFDRIALSCG